MKIDIFYIYRRKFLKIKWPSRYSLSRIKPGLHKYFAAYSYVYSTEHSTGNWLTVFKVTTK